MQLTSPSVYLIEEDDEGSRLYDVPLKSSWHFNKELWICGAVSGRACPFGCVVTDLVLPGKSGLEMFQTTRDSGWTIPAIVLTAFGNAPSVVRAFRCGIHDYLQKPCPSETLIRSVKEYLAISVRTHQSEASSKDALFRLNRLTKRQRQVLDRLIKGKAMKDIASEFKISFPSVSSLRKRLLKKLNIAGDVLLAEWILTHRLLLDQSPID